MIDASLINLPWATLVTLASGYIGYFIANVGLKDHHRPVEITFATLIFGLFSSIAYQGTILLGLGEYPAALAAVIYSFTCGACWRKYGRRLMYRYLRDHDISWSDDTNSAWQQMFGHTQYRVTEIFVYLKDGSGLLSRLPGNYEEWPNGPFTLGNHGDISLYVTHRKSINGDDWVEYEGVVHQSWGALATWVPADQIARVDIRRRKA